MYIFIFIQIINKKHITYEILACYKEVHVKKSLLKKKTIFSGFFLDPKVLGHAKK